MCIVRFVETVRRYRVWDGTASYCLEDFTRCLIIILNKLLRLRRKIQILNKSLKIDIFDHHCITSRKLSTAWKFPKVFNDILNKQFLTNQKWTSLNNCNYINNVSTAYKIARCLWWINKTNFPNIQSSVESSLNNCFTSTNYLLSAENITPR